MVLTISREYVIVLSPKVYVVLISTHLDFAKTMIPLSISRELPEKKEMIRLFLEVGDGLYPNCRCVAGSYS